MQRRWFAIAGHAGWVGVCLTAAALAGCAEPGPKGLQLEPMSSVPTGAAATATRPSTDGPTAFRRMADTSRDGRPDYWQTVGDDGRVIELAFDTTGDGEPDQRVKRDAPAAGDRHLILLLDSIPFELVDEAWRAGRFRLFHPPARVISPFPVMTDLSFSELFDVSPSPGVEASFYDGRSLRGGYDVYAHGGNAGWSRHVDYALLPLVHAVAYLDPRKWYDHELGRIQRMFLAGRGDFRGYAVTPSGLGAWYGRKGHVAALEKLDAACEYIMHTCGGRVQITAMSDHGHALVKSRRIPLSKLLAGRGWRVRGRINSERDVVVPEFGVVSCAAIHTRRPADVARDCIDFEGVELAMYRPPGSGEIVVLGRDGQATISQSAEGRFSVRFDRGDPLKLSPVWEQLRTAGRLDERGFADDGDLWEATREAAYPDAVRRIWRAFNGLVENAPDVYLSIADGYHCGSKFMSRLVDISAVHGGLGAISSTGFVMTTAGPLPAVNRMQDLAAALKIISVPVRRETSAVGAPTRTRS